MRVIAAIFSLISSPLLLLAGSYTFKETIHWTDIEQVRIDENVTMFKGAFSGACYYAEMGGLPFFVKSYPLPGRTAGISVNIINPVYDIAPDDFGKISGISAVTEEIKVNSSIGFEQKKPFADCSIIPVRRNPYNGNYEILRAFEIEIVTVENETGSRSGNGNYAQHSVLASGTWHKIAVTETGIYRISYAELQSFGLNPASIDPRRIRIYGNGGGMLPESLNEFKRDDLIENNIFISGESDGHFDPEDYILFYGESPHQWQYQPLSQAFQHIQNLYSDSTYYFLTADLGPGKRISTISSVTAAPNAYVNKFVDYDWHEIDQYNLSSIGRIWYGEKFETTTSYSYPYTFQDIDLGSQAYFRAYVAAKSEVTTTFSFLDGSNPIMTVNISGIPTSSNTYARPYVGSDWFSPSSSDIDIKINYQKNITSSQGWLNFFELNVTRNLIFRGGQQSFRDPFSASPGTIAEFTLGNANAGVQIWKVTDPTAAARIDAVQSGSNKTFRVTQDSIEEFIAFDGTDYLTAHYSGMIENQDLHGSGPHDMIIITHPLFRQQAERLAGFHASHDGLTVLVTEISDVYNEFSSGAQDITAIRNFMKMLYDEATAGQEPKYLLLIGDASFDYKNHTSNNSNFVPTWEDEESLVIVYSIASDDYYGFLDGPADNRLDIGIGRLPVQTAEQAEIAVNKIIHYATNSSTVMKDWRNYLCFVADDEDGNLHLKQAEEMASYIDSTYGAYNIDKIYVDAFPQVSTPGGQRAPDVNDAINTRIDKGCLIMNYTGHGGEVGWGHERFLENSDINSWTNYDHMPIFITATCEFSRYDDPGRISAGEYTFLNPNGGAIAMFTTARATFGGSNFNLNTALFNYIFEENDGGYYRFGDLIRLAKNEGGVDGNDKKFILLGDPALSLAYPDLDVVTTRINNKAVSEIPDTLQALQQIIIEGEVRNSGILDSGFNGTVYPVVFDKPSQVTTLATDDTSYPKTFDLQNNALYKGKAQVNNGKFKFTFIVPRDIAYSFGFGKISYYAANEQTDAHGFTRNIVVGGLDASVEPDLTGPAVSLFMNDKYFISGGVTDEHPSLLAFVSDSSGINTIGSGIGHDIVALLDGNTEKPIILNDFYESDINSYTTGTIRFPFHDLSEGLHTITLKVWDVFNNSADAYIEFNVVLSNRFEIDELMNYPNPFRSGTQFVFSHNQAEGDLQVKMVIFNLDGQVVRTFDENIIPAGYRTELLYWDGRDESGSYVANGLYFYRIEVTNELGEAAAKTAKLIMMK